MSKADMARICARVVKRPPHDTYNGFGKRAPSDQPPVLTPTELHAVRPAAVRPTGPRRGCRRRVRGRRRLRRPRRTGPTGPAGTRRRRTVTRPSRATGSRRTGPASSRGGPGTPQAYPAQPPYSGGQPHPGQPQPPHPGGPVRVRVGGAAGPAVTTARPAATGRAGRPETASRDSVDRVVRRGAGGAGGPRAAGRRGRGPRPRRPAAHPGAGRPRVRRAVRRALGDPSDVLQTTFDEGHEEMVLVKDIEMYSTWCIRVLLGSYSMGTPPSGGTSPGVSSGQRPRRRS